MELTGKKYNLTEGIIWQKLILYCLPILGGNLFQQLYTTTDAVIIGRFAGKDALASIDAIYSLTKLPVNFFT
ncbi:MAG: oligosaccharide flippase family protein, partial [Treponema sp.]|nr:oligosaccharide flippase family protein [Treponema sp.]